MAVGPRAARRGRRRRAPGAAPVPVGIRRRCRSGGSSPTTTSTATPAAPRGRGGAPADRRPGAAPRRRPHLRGRDAAPEGAGGSTSTRSTAGSPARSIAGLARLGVDAPSPVARATTGPGRAGVLRDASRVPTCGSGTASCVVRPRCSAVARVLQHGSILLDRLAVRRDRPPGASGGPRPGPDDLRRVDRDAARSWVRPRPARGGRRPRRGLPRRPSTSTSRRGVRTLDLGSHVETGPRIVAPVRVGTLSSMRCRRCGHLNEAGANFCSSCGEPLPATTTRRRSASPRSRTAELDDEFGEALAELPDGHGHARRAPGPEPGSAFVLDRTVTALGRHPDSDIFLDDITVSRRHAVITRHRPRATRCATPARSTAPTSTTSGSTPRRCSDLDELQIGRFVLVFLARAGRSP